MRLERARWLASRAGREALAGLGSELEALDAAALASAQARYTQEVVARLEARIRELEARNDELMRLDRMKDTFIQ
ncbi:MAG: hypothetical protein WHT63_01140, partial [Tepidiforma sp.]